MSAFHFIKPSVTPIGGNTRHSHSHSSGSKDSAMTAAMLNNTDDLPRDRQRLASFSGWFEGNPNTENTLVDTASSIQRTDTAPKSSFLFISPPSKHTSYNALVSKESQTLSPIRPAFIVHTSPSVITSQESHSTLAALNTINSESKLLSESAAWKQAQAQTFRHQTELQRLYERHSAVYQQLQQTRQKMREAQTEKEEALGMENYLAAEASCIKRDRLNQHMYELFVSVMGPLDHQLHQAWGSFATVLIKESEITETWAITAQQAMTERNEKLTKVDTSYRQHYETKLQTISTKRAEAEQEKSEIAFDLDMWEQSDSEFQEKISERVHNEQEEREKLLVKEQTLQEEINALVECVEQLKRQREGCIARLEQLESIVQEKTAEFAPEQSTHRDEYVSINKRMKDTEERCTELDQEGSELHYQLNQHTKEIERERELLKTKEKDTIDALGQAERNRKSATIIHHILFNTLETGDQVMKEKKQAIVQAQEAFLQYKKEIESLQHRVYTSQQKLDGLNETIEHTEFQLKSLSRQKRLAVENGQFQNAATAAARITAIEGSLEIATKKREVQEMKVIKAQETLKEYENKVFAVEREFTALEMEAGSIIVKELKKAKASIKETQTASLDSQDKWLRPLMEWEIQKFDQHIESVCLCLDTLSTKPLGAVLPFQCVDLELSEERNQVL